MRDTINFLKNYIPKIELQILVSGLRKYGKKSFYGSQIREIERIIKAVPPLYANDGLGRDAPVRLHYFCGATDFWISELDRETGEGFGYACLNGDTYNAEFGYVSIPEILKIPYLELDLYWDDQTTFRDVLKTVRKGQ